ncbi:MAG TPA: hypothetical protein VE987_12605 [Polyangiaceae bacterium]|nr:hypothetical protein [Polyangiaceae bacterium]
MNSLTLAPLTLAGFEAVPSVKDATIELALRGNADMTVSATLGKYLKELDAQTRHKGVRAVHVKLGDLYFLSSSCFQAIAAWVLSIAGRAPEDRYTVHFETHAAQGWQKRSLEAIRRVAPAVTVVS